MATKHEDAQIAMTTAIERTKKLISEQEARIARLKSLGARTKTSTEFLTTLHEILDTQEALLRSIVLAQHDVNQAVASIIGIERKPSVESSATRLGQEEADSP
jgi:hypothetical protein